MKTLAIILMLGVLGVPLTAQTPGEVPDNAEPTPEKESFVMQPSSLESGADGQTLRFVSNEDAAFSNSSSKPPAVTFSAGAKLSPGTFQILNQNEAQCVVDVEEDAIGTIEVRIELYSVNGSKVLRTLRGTLGVIDDTPVSGSGAEVGAESVNLVIANSTEPQTAGAIRIQGEIIGTVTVTAPTGMTFAEAPVATSTKASINAPGLQAANTVFSFGIGNTSLENVVVRVANIKYNTGLFSTSGGVAGDLSVEVGGSALSNQTALVVNAFTGKSTIEGGNDIPEQPESTGSESSDSTDESESSATPAVGGGVSTGSRRSRELGEGSRREGRNDNRNNGNNTGRSAPGRAPDVDRRSGSVPPPPNSAPPASSPPAPRPAAGGTGASPVAGGKSPGSSEMGGTGSMGSKPAKDDGAESDGEVEVVEPVELQLSAGLHFCDKEFKPLTAVVLDKLISGEAGGRIWIVLKLKKDKNPEKVDSATVTLTVDGTPRELALTETGKNTLEFRCGKDGVLIIADEDPDSNRDESEKQSPPKPRVR